jgi:hypothetical protein
MGNNQYKYIHYDTLNGIDKIYRSKQLIWIIFKNAIKSLNKNTLDYIINNYQKELQLYDYIQDRKICNKNFIDSIHLFECLLKYKLEDYAIKLFNLNVVNEQTMFFHTMLTGHINLFSICMQYQCKKVLDYICNNLYLGNNGPSVIYYDACKYNYQDIAIQIFKYYHEYITYILYAPCLYKSTTVIEHVLNNTSIQLSDLYSSSKNRGEYYNVLDTLYDADNLPIFSKIIDRFAGDQYEVFDNFIKHVSVEYNNRNKKYIDKLVNTLSFTPDIINNIHPSYGIKPIKFRTLLDPVSLTYNKKNYLKSPIRIDEANNTCQICMDNRANAVIVPCGHVLCFDGKCKDGIKECHLCRGSIEKIIKLHI